MGQIRTSGNSSGVAGFFSKHWYAIPIFIYLIIKFLPKTLQTLEQGQLQHINNDPVRQAEALTEITTNTDVHQAAMDIWEGSGLGYPIWHYKHWTEDDEKMYNAIMSVSVGGQVGMPLRQAYYIVSGGNNLQEDMTELLDNSYMQHLTW